MGLEIIGYIVIGLLVLILFGLIQANSYLQYILANVDRGTNELGNVSELDVLQNIERAVERIEDNARDIAYNTNKPLDYDVD